MTTYNNVFNGNFVQPSTVSFRNIVLNASVQLTWPTTYLDDAANNVAASVMTVQANAGTPTTLLLGLNPVATTIGLDTVVITGAFNSAILTGSQVTIVGSTDVNAIIAAQINIITNAQSLGANSFTYATGGIANATGSGGGAAVSVTYPLYNSITLPDANQVSKGQPLTFVNNGANPFYIFNNAGGFLLAILPSQTWDLILEDNTTVGGTWLLSQRGAVVSTANASAIAGLGLTTINSTLNTNFPSKVLAGNYTANLADRGSLLVWQAGVGTINLPSAALPTPAGYYLAVNNNGTGVVNVTTTDGSTIDSFASFPLNPGASSEFIYNSPNWNSLGFGTETFFQVNALTLNVAAGGLISLTNQQSSRLIQTYTGDLAQQVTIEYPATPGQWYVFNSTNGAFPLLVKVAGNATTFAVPVGGKVILYTDGATLFQTPNVTLAANFAPGNVGAPTIIFTNSATTGFYSFGAQNFGFSAGGNLAANLGQLQPGIYGLSVAAGNSIQITGTNLGFFGALKTGAMAASITWTLPLADATVNGQFLKSDGAGNLSFNTTTFPNNISVNQLLYANNNNSMVGLATANNGVLVTSAGGAPSISTTLPQPTQLNIISTGTITTGVWNGTPVTVQFGGTGVATLTTAYGTLCAGTTATNPVQTVAPGAATQVLTSNGAGALPTYQAIPFPVVPFVTNIPKVVATFTNMVGNPPTISYNVGVANITRVVGIGGQYTITYANPFVTNFPVVIATAWGLNTDMFCWVNTSASNQCQINVVNHLGNPVDPPDGLFLSVMGV